MTHEERMRLIADERYPRSAKYDPEWMYENKMGCQCLWLTESLSRVMTLEKGMRVLDLGCGRALSSIFLAKEFGVTVFATDLWIGAADNWKRIVAAGAQDLVVPIHADAHALPYGDDFFDAILCVNSFQFYGTADTFLADHLAHLLREGGQFGLALWGPDREFGGRVPEFLAEGWWPDFYYFHSLDWWKWHFVKSGLFDIEMGDDLDGDGVRVTRQWAKIMDKYDERHNNGIMRWNRIVARRNGASAEGLRV